LLDLIMHKHPIGREDATSWVDTILKGIIPLANLLREGPLDLA
jgi:hypothetical protein